MPEIDYTKVSLLVRTDNEVLRYWYKGGCLTISTFLGLIISTYWASLSAQKKWPWPEPRQKKWPWPEPRY